MVKRALSSRVVVACAGLVLSAGLAGADSVVSPPAFSFFLEPSVAFPLGPGVGYFLPGVAARIGGEYTPPSSPMFSLRGGVIYGFTPIALGLGTTSLVGGVAGVSWRVPVVGRLSAHAFADGGYAQGMINGNSAASASMPVVEGGIGLSWLVSPNAVLRLDSSYLYFVGANGSLAVSLGILVRPWPSAARPTIRSQERTGLRIEEVALDTVYPSLGRFYDNHPVGKALIRNTGRRSVFELKVSYRILGASEHSRESASRVELRPGETWDAPLRMILDSLMAGPGASKGTAPASAQSEVTVTFVEGGEQWELRRDAPLDVQVTHVVSADDFQGAAAFVLPMDPALRDLSDSLIAAIGTPGAAGDRGRPVRAAFAVREVVRLLGLRITADPIVPSAPAEKGLGVRRLKYPRETLHDRAGNSWDLAVLCASLLEAAGVRAALVETSGHLLIAVEPDPDDTSSSVLARGDSLLLQDGRSWLPVESTRLDGTFRDAVAEALRSWKKASASGGSLLAPVRDAWAQYPPSVPPPADPENGLPIPGRLRDALKTAVAAFSAGGDHGGDTRGVEGNANGAVAGSANGAAAVGTAGGAAATAKPAARRLLVVFTPNPAASWSDLQRATLADSLSLALKSAAPGVMVIPFGTAGFPTSPDERKTAARENGADCYIVVGMSGDRNSPLITAATEDLLATGNTGAKTGARVGPLSLQNVLRPEWGPIVSMVAGVYGSRAAR